MTGKDEELDAMIREALESEDRELLAHYGSEPGFFAQAFSIFRGSLGWVMATVMFLVFVSATLSAWMGWHFFTTSDPILSLRWGLGAVVCVNVVLFLRGVLMQQISTNRVLRELKRLELQVVRAQHRAQD